VRLDIIASPVRERRLHRLCAPSCDLAFRGTLESLRGSDRWRPNGLPGRAPTCRHSPQRGRRRDVDVDQRQRPDVPRENGRTPARSRCEVRPVRLERGGMKRGRDRLSGHAVGGPLSQLVGFLGPALVGYIGWLVAPT